MKDQCYEFIKGANNKVSIVGFGSYGEVKLARNVETKQIVAIKMIHGRNAKSQIDVHHKLNHPNIIKLLNYYYENDKNITYMVLQYAESGTLHNAIKFGYGQLPKERVKRYFRDVCKAVDYLHSLKYMHRDIKPENILLTKDDHAKLCDFGFAAILQYRSTLCGTYEYMAPEMIQQKPYDYRVDIWALGILLFELIQGTAPFRGQSGEDVINEMKKPIIFSNRFQKQEKQLIKKILRVNAENRPSVSAILQHPYLAGLSDNIAIQKTEVVQKVSKPIEKVEKVQKVEKTQRFEKHEKPERIHSNLSSKSTSTILSEHESRPQFLKLEKNSLHTSVDIPEFYHPPKAEERNYKIDRLQKIEKQQKQQSKQFKYFVPQGIKTPNANNVKASNSYSTMTSSSNQPSTLSSGSGSGSGQYIPQTNNNINSSIQSSSHFRPQMPIPNYVPVQKIPNNHNHKINYGGQTVKIGTQQKPVLSNPNYMGFNGHQNPNQMKKN